MRGYLTYCSLGQRVTLHGYTLDSENISLRPAGNKIFAHQSEVKSHFPQLKQDLRVIENKFIGRLVSEGVDALITMLWLTEEIFNAVRSSLI